MAEIRAFQGVRPAKELVSEIASLPYDVYSSSEARKIVEQNPRSFLKIDRAETQFPEGTDMYSQKVYDRARDTLVEMEKRGEFCKDESECYYVYTQRMRGRKQTGLVCCVSVNDYLTGVIKKHESTREDKKKDRTCHVETCSAHTGPVFMAYCGGQKIRENLQTVTEKRPLYDFETEDGVRHQLWQVADQKQIECMTEYFAMIERLYIVDGHHRAEAAVKVAEKRRRENPDYNGTEQFNYFLAVLFPAEELMICDYNRVVRKTGEYTDDELINKLKPYFDVQMSEDGRVYPSKKGEIGMYMDGRWFRLNVKQSICPEDIVDGLDVSILQNMVLEPIFGIHDPKTDPRIQFVGGSRGLSELENIVDRESDAAAFAMYPVSMEELICVADAGRLMPPKSTWFEPKLLSGLLIHKF